MVALLALTGLQQLESLILELCDQPTTEELGSGLCTLCLNISTLQSISVQTGCDVVENDKCKQVVQAQLATWGMGHIVVEIDGVSHATVDTDGGSSYGDAGSEQGGGGSEEGVGSEEGGEEGYHYSADDMEEDLRVVMEDYMNAGW